MSVLILFLIVKTFNFFVRTCSYFCLFITVDVYQRLTLSMVTIGIQSFRADNVPDPPVSQAVHEVNILSLSSCSLLP